MKKLFWSSIFLLLASPSFAAPVIYMQQGAAISVAASITRYFHLIANSRFNDDMTTESYSQVTYQSAGVLSNLYINILTNTVDAASTFRTRKNVGNGSMTVSITGDTSGKFEDTVNTDAVTAGDEWNYILTTGAGGGPITFKIASCIFHSSSNTVTRLGGDSNGDVDLGTSATLVGPLNGDDALTNGGADTTVGTYYRTGGTLSNLFFNPTVNGRSTTTTVRSRVNSGNGNLVISVGAGVTGFLEDTSNSDVISVDDLVNYAVISGTGTGNITYRSIVADFTTTNNQTMYIASAGGGQTVLTSVTTYYPFAGALRTSTTETDMQAETNLAFTASLLQCNISANTISENSTLRMRVNTGNGNQVVTITASTTGVFQDTTNTDVFDSGDVINYQLITGGTGTSLVIRSISILGETQKRIILIS